MSFTYSAPEMSPEEEREELEQLSTEERQKIKDDMYGRGCFEESEEMWPSGSSQMKEALHMMPVEEKDAYIEALERCPDVVRVETDAIAFLRADEYCAEAAARRVAHYWKCRRDIFGDRAFLPMTLAGAMAEDLETLEKGLVSVPPPDQHGRGVIFWHRTRMNRIVASRSSILRTVFYVLHTAITESQTAQMRGFVMEMNVKFFNPQRDFDRIFIRKCTDLFTNALPMRIMGFHLCSGSHGRNIFGFIGSFLKKIITKRVRLHLEFHTGHDSDLLRELQEYGISPESVHQTLGGQYTDDMFLAWLKRREIDEKRQAQQVAAPSDRESEVALLQVPGSN